jgi:Tfp pilus assembly protein PilN
MASKTITGLAIRQRSVSWTTLREKKGQMEIVENRTVNLDLPPGAADITSPEAAGPLKAACASLRGRLALAIPSGLALMRVVNLPTNDPGELKDMVDLQVDKFSPFPVAQMAVSFEQLAAQNGSSRVLVVAAQREQVDRIGEAFHTAGFRLHEMDVEVLGWWHLLKENGHVAETGQHILLLLDVASVELIVAQDGVPLVFRSLGMPGGGRGEEFVREMVEEAGYTLTTLEAEQGTAPSVRLSVWYWEAPEPALLEALGRECGTAPETHGMNELPPLSEGLARRAQQRGPLTLDLAPAEWHVAETSRRARSRLLFASAVFLGVWALAVGGFLLGMAWQENKLKRLKQRVETVEKPAAGVRQIKQKVEELDRYSERSRSALECLREISALLPPGLDLTSMLYKKGNEITLRGETTPEQVDQIYQFFEAIEGSPLFLAVENRTVTTNPGGGRRTTQFTATIKLGGRAS